MRSRRFQRGIFGIDDLIVGAVGGALIGGLFSSRGQQQANNMNVDLSREQMAWQTQMSSTAYQRATADMEAAGLNPMLAYQQGGASTPAGQLAQVGNVGAAAVGGATSSAQQALALGQGLQSIEQSKAVTQKAEADAAKVRSETLDRDINNAQALTNLRNLQYSGEKTLREQDVVTADALLRRAQVQATSNAAEASRIENERQRSLLSEEQRGGAFAADVAYRKSRSRLEGLEASKQDVLKGAYELLPNWWSKIKQRLGSSAYDAGNAGGGYYGSP